MEKVERYCNIKTVLKVVYLQHKQNRRVDFLLATLMKIARDKTSERLLMQEKGKHTHRVCEINTRHNENIWKVTLQHQDVFYTVHRLLTSCECKISCSSCNVCVHQYSCSCLDATIHATVCKHIHLIHEITKQPDKSYHKSRQSELKNKQ